jgi:hypothetical protein
VPALTPAAKQRISNTASAPSIAAGASETDTEMRMLDAIGAAENWLKARVC